MADYGAEVIKVESPDSGDAMRRWGHCLNGESLWWPTIARGKRSLALDLRDEASRDALRRLIDQVDVVLENFRPGTLDRWGLGYDELAITNPGVIVVHVSGYGQSGPKSTEAGFGSIGEAMGGIRHTTGHPDLPPARAGVSLGDSLAGMFAVIGTLAALHERSGSGRGQEVDVAIYEAVAALMESTLADHALAGVTRGRSGSVLPGVAPSNAYPTNDGAEVLIAANADTVFDRLTTAMGEPELATDVRFETHVARGQNMAALDERIATWTARHETEDLLARLAESGVPAGRIYTAPDMLADPHFQARDMVLQLTNAAGLVLPTTGVVPKFSRSVPTDPTPGPTLGQHSAYALCDVAGLDSATYDSLTRSGRVRDA